MLSMNQAVACKPCFNNGAAGNAANPASPDLRFSSGRRGTSFAGAMHAFFTAIRHDVLPPKRAHHQHQRGAVQKGAGILGGCLTAGLGRGHGSGSRGLKDEQAGRVAPPLRRTPLMLMMRAFWGFMMLAGCVHGCLQPRGMAAKRLRRHSRSPHCSGKACKLQLA